LEGTSLGAGQNVEYGDSKKKAPRGGGLILCHKVRTKTRDNFPYVRFWLDLAVVQDTTPLRKTRKKKIL